MRETFSIENRHPSPYVQKAYDDLKNVDISTDHIIPVKVR